MKTFDVVLVATVKEVMTIEARDEDAAADIALQIAQSMLKIVLCEPMASAISEINSGRLTA